MGDRISYDPEYDMDEEMTAEERWQRLTDIEKVHVLAWMMEQKKTDETAWRFPDEVFLVGFGVAAGVWLSWMLG